MTLDDWLESATGQQVVEAAAEGVYNADTGMPDCWLTEEEGVREWYRRNCPHGRNDGAGGCVPGDGPQPRSREVAGGHPVSDPTDDRVPTCPHVHTSDEGTAYCDLAETAVRERDALASELACYRDPDEPRSVNNPCVHPVDWMKWTDSRPLFCGLCDVDLQTEQPVIVELVVEERNPEA